MPEHATSTVYVEGIPGDATEREVAHIFRPFTGFKSVRLIHRDKVAQPGVAPISATADQYQNKPQIDIAGINRGAVDRGTGQPLGIS